MYFNKFLTILLFVFLFGCTQKEDNVLVVGTAADNPPYEFIQNDKVVGLDIDVINAIAKHLGKKVQIKNYDFHSLFAALSSREIDLIIAGLSITPERLKKVNFSTIYTSSNIAILHRAADNFDNVNDLTRSKIIGAQLGTILEQFAVALSLKFDTKLSIMSNNLLLIEELKSGVIDAVVIEEVQGRDLVAQNPDLASFALDDLSSEFAIALSKNSEDLKVNIDNAINTLKADGTIEAIHTKWIKN